MIRAESATRHTTQFAYRIRLYEFIPFGFFEFLFGLFLCFLKRKQYNEQNARAWIGHQAIGNFAISATKFGTRLLSLIILRNELKQFHRFGMVQNIWSTKKKIKATTELLLLYLKQKKYST